MAWTVNETKGVKKQLKKLPVRIREAYDLLIADLKLMGPEVSHWYHYGKLIGRKKDPQRYHCHLNKGTPRFVAIWEVRDQTVTILEMSYVGSHEGANY